MLLLATLSQQFVVMLAAYALMDFTFFLSIDEVRKRRRRIPRCALSNPRYSLVRFEVLYNRYSPYVVDGKVVPLRHERGTKGGRPRTFDAASCLALILCYTRTRGSLFGLQLMYGATHSVLVVFLKYSMRLLYKVLMEDDAAKVCIPSCERIQEYQSVIRLNYPALDGAWCVMDGLKLLVQLSGVDTEQNTYYNGWLHDHFVSCVYVFVPSGHIVAQLLSNPGSWHDSLVALNGNIYNELESIFEACGGKCAVDSAFNQKR
jgi:hypothetical protein